MAANFGKFIDRSPTICAAGKPTGNSDEGNIGTKLKENSEQYEKIQKTLTLQSLQEAEVDKGQQETIVNQKDTIGDTTLLEQDYGHEEHASGSVTELMSFPGKPYEVMLEWDNQREEYERTYDDYNRYEEKEYHVPHFIHRVLTKTAPKGVWVRCACDRHEEQLGQSNQIEADYLDRFKPQLGKSLSPNHNIDSVPEGFAFGKPLEHKSYDGMDELLKDLNCPLCIFKKDCFKWLTTLNKLRNTMKRRVYSKDFHFDDFYVKCLNRDIEDIGFLPINEFYDLCDSEHIPFRKDDMEPLLKLLHIIERDRIEYGRFLDIVDVNKPAIKIIPIHDIPKKNQYYDTSSVADSRHYIIAHNADVHAAGLPTAEEPKGSNVGLDRT